MFLFDKFRVGFRFSDSTVWRYVNQVARNQLIANLASAIRVSGRE